MTLVLSSNSVLIVPPVDYYTTRSRIRTAVRKWAKITFACYGKQNPNQMKKLLLLLTAAGIAVPLCAIGQTHQSATTNLLSDDSLIAAVFKTAKQPTEAAQKKLIPAPKFAHSASIRPASVKNQKEMEAKTAATNALVRAVSAPLPPVRPLTYEFVRMSTGELADRKAVIGWKIIPKRNR